MGDVVCCEQVLQCVCEVWGGAMVHAGEIVVVLERKRECWRRRKIGGCSHCSRFSTFMHAVLLDFALRKCLDGAVGCCLCRQLRLLLLYLTFQAEVPRVDQLRDTQEEKAHPV